MELTQIIDPLINPILREETMRINELIKGKGAAIDEDLQFTKFIFTSELSFLKVLTEVNKAFHKKVQPLLEKAKAYAVPANLAFFCFTILETAEDFDRYKVIWMQNMLYEDAFAKPTKTDSNVSPDKTIKTMSYQSPYYPEDKTNQLQEWEYRNHLLKQIAPNVNLWNCQFEIQGNIYFRDGTDKDNYNRIKDLLCQQGILQKLLYIKNIVSMDKPNSISYIEKILHTSLKADYPNGFLLLVGLAIQRQHEIAIAFNKNSLNNIVEYSGIAGKIPSIQQYFYHLFIEHNYDFFLSFFKTFLEKHANKTFYVHPSFVSQTLLEPQKSLGKDAEEWLFCPYFDQLINSQANGLYARILTQSDFTFKTDEKLEENEKKAIEENHKCPFTNGWESYQAGPFCCHTTPFLPCYFERKNNLSTKEAEKQSSDESKEKNNSLPSEDNSPLLTKEAETQSSEGDDQKNDLAHNNLSSYENDNQSPIIQEEKVSSEKDKRPIFVYLLLIIKQFFQLLLEAVQFHFYK